MQIFVNQQSREIEPEITIDEFINQIGYNYRDGIAIAINDEIVPKNKWAGRKLNEEDNVTLILAKQGG